MNTKKLIFLILIALVISGCKEEITVMSAVKDGEELEEGTSIPFTLMQNYPNPFNPSTQMEFSVSKTMRLKMSVFTEDWELVKVLFDENKFAGYYRIDFSAVNSDGENFPSGNYYYTLEGEGLILVRQMKLMK
jgi:outer membrane lipoprotein-sorting protein